MILVSTLLLIRVYTLTINSHKYYEELSKENYKKTFYSVAPRGAIKDRNGKYLAVNKIGFKIAIKPHLRSVKSFEKVKKISKLIVKYFPTFKYKKLLKRYKKLDSPYRHNYIDIVEYIPYMISLNIIHYLMVTKILK